jgi:hypothetical protein
MAELAQSKCTADVQTSARHPASQKGMQCLSAQKQPTLDTGFAEAKNNAAGAQCVNCALFMSTGICSRA